nr:MAG TPA: adenine specific DNA methyltransferase [Caudoviricetes sp.]
MAEQIALNCDCMEYMRTVPDKYFDLACVDPPYGDASQSVNAERADPRGAEIPQREGEIRRTRQLGRQVRSWQRFGERFSKYDLGAMSRTGGTWAAKYQTGGIFDEDIRTWDKAPPKEYFDELFRISKNQIIWGGNYFDLPPTRCFIILRKKQVPTEGFSMSPVEYAWTSFFRNAEMYEAYTNGGSGREDRFHPTQKPIELYEWTFRKFANAGDRIIDTHLGSGSSRIAAYRLGLEFVGCELYKPYSDKSCERFERETAQSTLF